MGNTSKLLLDEQPLQVLPTLAVALGLNRAMFVQQLHYWLQKPSAHVREDEEGIERRWIYNTYEGWHEQFPFWGTEAIKKIVLHLEARGVVKTTDEFNRSRTDRTKWYTVDYDALNALFEDEDEGEAEVPGHQAKSNDEDAKSNALEGAKSTHSNQRVPETNNRDSDLQSGERRKTPSPPRTEGAKDKSPRPISYRHHAFTRARELETEVEALGWELDPLPESRVKEYAAFYERAAQKGWSLDALDEVIRWLFAKASGLIPDEPQAWCAFGTAMRAHREKPIPRSATRNPTAKPEELRPHDKEYEAMVSSWLGETA